MPPTTNGGNTVFRRKLTLYMVEDLYSRYGVHWEVFAKENSEHTCQVIEQSMWREKCLLDPPVLHRDNGSVLKSQMVTQKLYDLGIASSHSRPRVSNDNAYVESLLNADNPEDFRITALNIRSKMDASATLPFESIYAGAGQRLQTAILQVLFTTGTTAAHSQWLKHIQPTTSEQEQLILRILSRIE